MTQASDLRKNQIGIIMMALLGVAMAAAFNLQKFPGFRGETYHADESRSPASE